MATLEDKILGERREYYCSSSEDEDHDNDDSDKGDHQTSCEREVPSTVVKINKWNGSSSNTGPKGVISDWQRYKKLEAEKRAEQKPRHIELIKKLSLSCQSTLDLEKEKLSQTDPELADLLEDDFLLEYQRQKVGEMLSKANKLEFGSVINLSNANDFLEAVDNEDETVTVIVHIYSENKAGCQAMNGCLISLAEEYSSVKFCKILGIATGLSDHFNKKGVPALLVYKNGQVIGNFVHVTDILGTDFYASDVENFLHEHAMLFDKKDIPKMITSSYR